MSTQSTRNVMLADKLKRGIATPTAAYSITIKVSLDNMPGTLGKFTTALGTVGANIAAIPGFSVAEPGVIREVDVLARSVEHAHEIVRTVSCLEGVSVLEWWDRTFRLHENGKIEIRPLCAVSNEQDLAMAYTPGVARICEAIAQDQSLKHTYTMVKNFVAIVSDGTAVLGMGDIGPAAALPVMEGKALLFKEFGKVDAVPLCIDTSNPDEVVETIIRIAPSFGGINLEDIAAPAAFEIEERLIEALDIPVFHDDQHGTAIVVLAALINALKVVDKQIENVSVVISGMGAAGVSIGKMLLEYGASDIIGVDSAGAVHRKRDNLNPIKRWFAHHTNIECKTGSLSDVIAGADVFIGVSVPGVLTRDDVKRMASDPIVFALANPEPEIRPEEVADIASVMATGRSDFPNQINNVLAFPGVFRGALDAAATRITQEMNLAAALAIAKTLKECNLHHKRIMPSVFDKRVAPHVAAAVATCAIDQGVTRYSRSHA